MEQLTFTLTPAAVDDVTEKIDAYLLTLSLDNADRIRIRLGMEEILLRMLRTLEGQDGVFSWGKRWGHPTVHIRIKGPINREEDEYDDEFSDYSRQVIESMGLSPTEYYKEGWNHISLRLQKKKKHGPLLPHAAAISLAIVCGILAQMYPDSFGTVLAMVSLPILEAFEGVLTAIAGPTLLFSVMWGILCIGDTATLGTHGRRMMLRFIGISSLFTVLALGMAMPFFAHAHSDLGNLHQIMEIYEMLLGLLPHNVVAPFAENNMLQITVMGMVFGLAMLVLESHAAKTVAIVEQLNHIVDFIAESIIKLCPVFVFVSLTDIFLSDSVGKLLACRKLLLLQVSIPFILLMGVLLYTGSRCHISPALLMRKMLPAVRLAFITASSTEAYPVNTACCEHHLGINNRLTRFGLPLGCVMYMPSVSVSFLMIALFMSEQYAMTISPTWCVMAVLACVILSVAAPPIPGGALTCFAVLIAQMGIPTEALGIVIMADIIMDFFLTACNTAFLELELTLQARRMGMLDTEILHRQ